MSAWGEFRSFLDRPDGGIEVETISAGIELTLAVGLLWSAHAAENVPALGDLYWTIPHYVIAVPWLASSMLTIFGLLLYRMGNHLCAYLRTWGAYISGGVWFVMFLLQVRLGPDGSLITTAWSFFAAAWQVRIVISANRRRASWAAHG